MSQGIVMLSQAWVDNCCWTKVTLYSLCCIASSTIIFVCRNSSIAPANAGVHCKTRQQHPSHAGRHLLRRAPQGCTFVNQYVVVKTLGQGAYSRVKLALDTGEQRLVALKLLRGRPPRATLPHLLRYSNCSVAITANAHSIAPPCCRTC